MRRFAFKSGGIYRCFRVRSSMKRHKSRKRRQRYHPGLRLKLADHVANETRFLPSANFRL